MSDIQTMLNKVEAIFDATESALSNLNGRMSLKDLVSEVSVSLNQKPKDIEDFVGFFLHNSSVYEVKRGKTGGVSRRGVKADSKPTKTESKTAKTAPAKDSKDEDSEE